MTAAEIVKQLKSLGTASYKKVMLNHGVREPIFGVKVSELKKIERRVRGNHALALELFGTGIYDAQYLAGLLADASKMTRKDLQHWLKTGNCLALCGTLVAQLAAESPHGWEVALKWIDAKDERAAQAGWATLSSYVSITPDDQLDIHELKRLLSRVERTIHDQPNFVRYAMNGFVVAAGCFVPALTDAALKAAERIGTVSVDMGDTACEVPDARAYIRKVKDRGTIGRKRKAARC